MPDRPSPNRFRSARAGSLVAGPQHVHRGQLRQNVLLIITLLLGFALGSWQSFFGTCVTNCRRGSSKEYHVQASSSTLKTLVLYSFFDGDEVSWGNLRFFVDHGVATDAQADYILLLNGISTLGDARLPKLPPQARYVMHANECYDWGTYAWALKTQVQSEAYTYFLFINSSVRGPLLPAYVPLEGWTTIFTAKLIGNVKLVGPAISCEHFCITTVKDSGSKQRLCRDNAHVQSVAVATDMEGLRVLQDAGYVLTCHDSRSSAIYYGEIGASRAMLDAGYTIDSFQLRYQGVDWQQRRNWQCNHAVTPIGKRTFDGVTTSALEFVFPKLKGSLLESGLPSHFEAFKLSEWRSLQAQDRNITDNWFASEGRFLQAEDALLAEAKGQKCFDWDYYKRKNPDVASLPQQAMWTHFLTQGATQFREHRWLCGLDVDAIIPHQ